MSDKEIPDKSSQQEEDLFCDYPSSQVSLSHNNQSQVDFFSVTGTGSDSNHKRDIIHNNEGRRNNENNACDLYNINVVSAVDGSEHEKDVAEHIIIHIDGDGDQSKNNVVPDTSVGDDDDDIDMNTPTMYEFHTTIFDEAEVTEANKTGTGSGSSYFNLKKNGENENAVDMVVSNSNSCDAIIISSFGHGKISSATEAEDMCKSEVHKEKEKDDIIIFNLDTQYNPLEFNTISETNLNECEKVDKGPITMEFELPEPTKEIRRLDSRTSSAIRKGQIISTVADIIRELVDNAIDAHAPSVQIHIEKFGIKKIEVRDTGSGIRVDELPKAVAGGHTSKLLNPEHLSCNNHYGFRGEALAAICSLGNVFISTKTREDQRATKYELDNSGEIKSQTTTSMSTGTIVCVEDIFSKFPVRRQYIQDTQRCATELKEIETYLKAVGIANPQVHLSFIHNSNRIWTKAAVSSVDQALISVLGHAIASHLQKCGPVDIEISSQNNVDKQKGLRIMEAFLLKKPIDMKKFSFTSNKMTLIFVNRKRVVIREIEKLIQRYTAATIENPAPAYRRRFPVAVLNIRIPYNEVDFNRDSNKSKVFLIHKEFILKKFEDILQTFYGVECFPEDTENYESSFSSSSLSVSASPAFSSSIIGETEKTSTSDFAETNYSSRTNSIVIRTDDQRRGPQKYKHEAVNRFLQQLPAKSKDNFSHSSKSTPMDNSKRPCYSPVKYQQELISSKEIIASDTQNNTTHSCIPTSMRKDGVSNFDIDIDELFLDTPPEAETTTIEKDNRTNESQLQLQLQNSKQNKTPSQMKVHTNTDKNEKLDIMQWIHGRVPDSSGNIIKNVNIISGPGLLTQPSSSQIASSQSQAKISRKDPSGTPVPLPQNTFLRIGSGLSGRSQSTQNNSSFEPKRRRLDQTTNNKNQMGVSFASTPRQITLDRFKKWDTPKKQKEANISIPINDNQNRLIGPTSDNNFYLAKVQDIIGTFCPLNFLHHYPSLKYDLNVSVLPHSPQEAVHSQLPTTLSQYYVANGSVPKLFEEFLRIVDPTKEFSPKIFHPSVDKKTIHNICNTKISSRHH